MYLKVVLFWSVISDPRLTLSYLQKRSIRRKRTYGNHEMQWVTLCTVFVVVDIVCILLQYDKRIGWNIYYRIPSRHETLCYCWLNVDPASTTLYQHWAGYWVESNEVLTFWGWWDEWDDTALQAQNSKFVPWRSEVEHATARSQSPPPHNIDFLRMSGEETFCFFKTWMSERGFGPTISDFPSRQL